MGFDVEIAMKKTAFTQNWIRSVGDRYVDSNIDRLMADPKSRAEVFDRATGRIPQARVTGFSRVNPFAHMRASYAADPHAAEHFSKVFRQRLQSPQFRQSMFGERKSIPSSLYNLIGPSGRLGLAGAFGGRLLGHFASSPSLRWAGHAATLGGLLTTVGSGAARASAIKNPEMWADAFGKDSKTTIGQEARDRLNALSTLYGSISSIKRAGDSRYPQAMKLAFLATNPSFGRRTDFGADRTSDASRLLNQHFPYRAARDAVLGDPNIGVMDKAKIIGSMYRANDNKTTGSVGVSDFIPSLVGAGVGYAGASAVSRLLNLPPSMATAARLGSTFAGAVLNNPKVFKL